MADDRATDFDSLINNGWRSHADEPEAVAGELNAIAELVDNSEKALKLAKLTCHVYGEHLADWDKAEALIGRIVSRLGDTDGLGPVLSRLALAQYMSGNAPHAMATEMRAAADSDNPLAVVVELRILAAVGLAEMKRYDDADALYTPTMAVIQALGETSSLDRAVAITSNNIGSMLVELNTRTDRQDKLMLAAAANGKKYWERAGTWQNAERADYLLALTFNAVGRFDDALKAAERGLDTIHAHGEDNADQAFLTLQAARAHKGLGASTKYEQALATSKTIATAIDASWFTGWYQSEVDKVTQA